MFSIKKTLLTNEIDGLFEMGVIDFIHLRLVHNESNTFRRKVFVAQIY